jgi:hypothetical protein
VPSLIDIPMVLVNDDTVKDVVVQDMPDDYWPINWLAADKIDAIIAQAKK